MRVHLKKKELFCHYSTSSFFACAPEKNPNFSIPPLRLIRIQSSVTRVNVSFRKTHPAMRRTRAHLPVVRAV